MNKIFSFIFLLISASCFAQTSPDSVKIKTPFEKEFGVNANLLIERIFNFSNDELPQSPYLTMFKLRKEKWTLRFGLGGISTKNTIRDEGFADSETEQTQGFDARLGIEKEKKIGNRWVASFGLDAVTDYRRDRTISDSGFDKVTFSTTKRGFGGGPVFGLKFNINEHLSLYTESYFYYMFSTSRESQIFENFPQFDDVIAVTESEKLTSVLPSTLWVLVRF